MTWQIGIASLGTLVAVVAAVLAFVALFMAWVSMRWARDAEGLARKAYRNAGRACDAVAEYVAPMPKRKPEDDDAPEDVP